MCCPFPALPDAQCLRFYDSRPPAFRFSGARFSNVVRNLLQGQEKEIAKTIHRNILPVAGDWNEPDSRPQSNGTAEPNAMKSVRADRLSWRLHQWSGGRVTAETSCAKIINNLYGSLVGYLCAHVCACVCVGVARERRRFNIRAECIHVSLICLPLLPRVLTADVSVCVAVEGDILEPKSATRCCGMMSGSVCARTLALRELPLEPILQKPLQRTKRQ